MRYLAYLAIAAFFTTSALVSIHKAWFGFIYGIPGRDLLAHFVGMGLLSFFMVLGFSSPPTRGRSLGPLASMAIATLLVTLDEVIQIEIPSRTFSLDDLAWSLAGVLVFGLAAAGIMRISQQRVKERY
jgi:VanZ family protein